MVGMSGKSSEPRGSSGSARKQQSSQSAPSSKPQPTAEALHLARILEGTSYPADMKDRILQVSGVVPNKSEEEICVALHDHDYDPERAITSLLDADAKQGEWTTSGRKGKKKGPPDAIVAPGDTSSGAAKTPGGTTRAASTRENYGGNVTVTRDGGGRGRGRGRSNFGRGRSDRGGRGENRGDRSRQLSSKSEGKKDEQAAPPSNAVLPLQGAEESWDAQPQVQPQPVEWQGQPEVTGDQERGTSLEWEKPSVTPQDPVTWHERDEVAPPIFPEALPTQTCASTTSTAECVVSNPSPLHICIPAADVIQGKASIENRTEAKSKRLKQKRLARSQIPSKPVEMPRGMATIDAQFSMLGIDFIGARSSSHSPVDQATAEVEAPPTNVPYLSTRQQLPPDHQQQQQQPGVPSNQLPKHPTPPSASFPLATPTLQPVHVLSAPEPISLPSSSRALPASGSGLGVATLPTKEVLAPLPREPLVHLETSSSPSPAALPQQHAGEVHRPPPSSSSIAASFPDQAVRLSSQLPASAVPSSSVAVTSGLLLSGPVTMGNLLHAQPSSTVQTPLGAGYHHPTSMQGSALLQGSIVSKAAAAGAQASAHTSAQATAYTGAQATAHTSAQAATHTAAQASAHMSAQVAAYTSAQAAAHMSAQVAAHTSAQVAAYTGAQAIHTSAQTAHSNAQAVHSAKHTPGPPGFPMYSQMMQPGYYMPNMTGYYPTPDTVGRYPYFHQPATDPGMGTAITREHVASNFGEQSKYVARAAEGTSPVVSNQSHQQQQQQGLQAQLGPAQFMNMSTYPQNPYGYFYPTTWFSAAPQQLPKPATNSFSGVGVGGPYQTHHGNLTSYEEVAAVSAHDFTKSYNAAALGKPGADSDLSAAFKQQPYDAKPAGGSGGFNNYGLLQMPASVPLQMVAQQQQQHDSMQSRGQQQQARHANKPSGGYGGWPQSTHNS